MKVFSLINYVGHKSKMLDVLLDAFPTVEGTFYDVFSGSSVVGLSSGHSPVVFVDRIPHLQDLYGCLQDPQFLETLEGLIDQYGLTNSSRKRRADYYEQNPDAGTLTWHGKKVPNYHLDQLNQEGRERLMADFNSGHFEGVAKSCAYMIAALYGRNSSVYVSSDGSLSGAVGPLDFSKRARQKFDEHLECMRGRDLSWVTGDFTSVEPGPSDFVYMDPPYLASGFKYGGWKKQDEERLLAWVDQLPCQWALSNVVSSGDRTNSILVDWAAQYHVTYLDKGYRKWGRQGEVSSGRDKKHQEVLVTNYDISPPLSVEEFLLG